MSCDSIYHLKQHIANLERQSTEAHKALEECLRLAIERIKTADAAVKEDVYAADVLMGIATISRRILSPSPAKEGDKHVTISTQAPPCGCGLCEAWHLRNAVERERDGYKAQARLRGKVLAELEDGILASIESAAEAWADQDMLDLIRENRARACAAIDITPGELVQ